MSNFVTSQLCVHITRGVIRKCIIFCGWVSCHFQKLFAGRPISRIVRCIGDLGVWFCSNMVNLTPLSGPVCVGLGSGGMAISPVLPIATRNLSYHYQQKCAGKPIGRCVHLIDGSRCFEMVRRGGGDVTIRTHLDRFWVWGRGVSDVV